MNCAPTLSTQEAQIELPQLTRLCFRFVSFVHFVANKSGSSFPGLAQLKIQVGIHARPLAGDDAKHTGVTHRTVRHDGVLT